MFLADVVLDIYIDFLIKLICVRILCCKQAIDRYPLRLRLIWLYDRILTSV